MWHILSEAAREQPNVTNLESDDDDVKDHNSRRDNSKQESQTKSVEVSGGHCSWETIVHNDDDLEDFVEGSFVESKRKRKVGGINNNKVARKKTDQMEIFNEDESQSSEKEVVLDRITNIISEFLNKQTTSELSTIRFSDVVAFVSIYK